MSYKELFESIDVNRDGSISLSEFTTVLTTKTSLQDTKLSELFKAADTNADGFLDLSEFSKLVEKHAELKTLAETAKETAQKART